MWFTQLSAPVQILLTSAAFIALLAVVAFFFFIARNGFRFRKGNTEIIVEGADDKEDNNEKKDGTV